jgi:hypothetical protein
MRSFLSKNDFRFSGIRSSVQRIHSQGSFLENVKESDLILTETYLDRSTKELPETHSIDLKNDPERFLSR